MHSHMQTVIAVSSMSLSNLLLKETRLVSIITSCGSECRSLTMCWITPPPSFSNCVVFLTAAQFLGTYSLQPGRTCHSIQLTELPLFQIGRKDWNHTFICCCCSNGGKRVGRWWGENRVCFQEAFCTVLSWSCLLRNQSAGDHVSCPCMMGVIWGQK